MFCFIGDINLCFNLMILFVLEIDIPRTYGYKIEIKFDEVRFVSRAVCFLCCRVTY